MGEVDHVGIVVSDAERSASFYVETLGYEVVEKNEDARLKAVYLKKGDQVVELLEYLGSEKQQRRAGVIDHLAYRVDDLERVVSELREKGVEPLFDSPRLVFGGRKKIIFFVGPDGERLELVQELG
ncbi:MAG: VOC family protein [Thermacetogeniaceae bacterium]